MLSRYFYRLPAHQFLERLRARLAFLSSDLYNFRQTCDLEAARTSYAKMVALNPDLEESRNARNYMGQIDGILPSLGCQTR